jgi:ubiquinone/menaquinone biosynthesis C-methylase UbiE
MSMPGVREAYDESARSWRRGPEAVYARLAEALVSVSPVDLAGARVLDVGAGTAVAARAALARGASSAFATDIAAEMLRGRTPGMPAVVADGALLPFPDRVFDLVTAGFCLGHMADPLSVLREIRRVGLGVVASAFPPGPGHPVKAAIDEVFTRLGFTTPAWYQHQKDVLEPRIDDEDALRAMAQRSGFWQVEVHRIDVDSGLDSPGAVVDWRVGMAHLAPFVASLAPDVLSQARAEAEDAVRDLLPVVIPMLALSAC